MKPAPRAIKNTLDLKGRTINTLTIGADVQIGTDTRQVQVGRLFACFRQQVLFGLDAFVETPVISHASTLSEETPTPGQ